ncbi:MAG TPA: hypothetical protein VIF62_08395 [Labilithrix sp.]
MGDLPLPVLVTHVADASAREYLRGVAHGNGTVHVVLVAAPAYGGAHALEVHVAGASEPLVLLAEPLGPPTSIGCPLRLRLREAPERAIQEPSMPSAPDLDLAAARTSTRPTHPAPAPTSYASDGEDSDWLEQGSDYRSVNPPSGAPPRAVSTAPSGGLASFLKTLADTVDKAQFAALVAPLGSQVQALLVQGETGPAWRLCSTLEIIAREPPGPRSRGEIAKEVLEIFRDPQLLAPLAQKIVDGLDDPERAASRLVVRAGKRGAHALYQARLKNDAPEARERFVALLRSIGPAAVPTIVKALDLLQTRLAASGAVEILVDVLEAVPPASDERLETLVGLYARSDVPPLAAAAANALTRVVARRGR